LCSIIVKFGNGPSTVVDADNQRSPAGELRATIRNAFMAAWLIAVYGQLQIIAEQEISGAKVAGKQTKPAEMAILLCPSSPEGHQR